MCSLNPDNRLSAELTYFYVLIIFRSMKYLFVALSLFVAGNASAQTGFAAMTKTQMDSAIVAGRSLVSAKLSSMKAAHASGNTAQFSSEAQQYFTLMRQGMMETGRMLDLDPAANLQAGLAKMAVIEQNFADYRTLIKATPQNRAEIIRKAEYFQTQY